MSKQKRKFNGRFAWLAWDDHSQASLWSKKVDRTSTQKHWTVEPFKWDILILSSKNIYSLCLQVCKKVTFSHHLLVIVFPINNWFDLFLQMLSAKWYSPLSDAQWFSRKILMVTMSENECLLNFAQFVKSALPCSMPWKYSMVVVVTKIRQTSSFEQSWSAWHEFWAEKTLKKKSIHYVVGMIWYCVSSKRSLTDRFGMKMQFYKSVSGECLDRGTHLWTFLHPNTCTQYWTWTRPKIVLIPIIISSFTAIETIVQWTIFVRDFKKYAKFIKIIF